ncbi:hypothetical protein ACTMTU_09075 [Streptomyces sp. OZ13]|uniref:hypothetical protein n=1 Tax=Streptomyces sp. OZ13 TaxID=3452210 RepID=UPI003F88D206
MAVTLYHTTCRTPGCSAERHKPGFHCLTCYQIRLITYDELADFNYDTKHWKLTRARVLRTAHSCALCPAIAKVADHHPKSRRELWAMDAKNIDDASRLRALCKSCHSKYTATQQGGFADPKRKTRSRADIEYERWQRERGTDSHGNTR